MNLIPTPNSERSPLTAFDWAVIALFAAVAAASLVSYFVE